MIIIQNGSYNPVHKNHVNNVIKSMEYLKEKTSNMYQYICLMCPANDQRIRSKCKNGLSLYHRYKMLRLATSVNTECNIMIDISQIYGEQQVTNYRNIFGCHWFRYT